MIYQRQKDGFSASEYALAFWYPGAQHGGPLAALAVHHILEQPTKTEMKLSRLNMNIMKPVSCDPITVTTSILRQGKNIQVVDVKFWQNANLVVSATGLKYRVKVGVSAAYDPLPFEAKDKKILSPDYLPSHPPIHFAKDAVKLQPVSGEMMANSGQGSMWISYDLDHFIDDQAPSGVMKLAMYADFGNALSSLFSPKEGIFINADLSMEIFRYPCSNDVYLTAQTFAGHESYGVVHGKLYDEKGLLGFCHQTVLLDKR